MTDASLSPAVRRHQRPMSAFWRRFSTNRSAQIGFLIVGVYLFFAAFGPWVAPYDPLAGSLRMRLAPPSTEFWLGTDDIGRDILSRIIYGARVSFIIMATAVAIGLVIGVLIGVVGGYFGGIIDSILMRIIDVMLAFPSIFLAIGIVAALGPGFFNVIVATGLFSVPQFARIARASVLSLKEREFVEAAHASGESTFNIISLYLLPNSLAPLMVQTTLRMSTVLLTAAALSFLGLGVQPPTPEWGAMLSNGRTYVMIAPHVATYPGLAIFIVVIGFNLLGDGLRDTLDPRMKQ